MDTVEIYQDSAKEWRWRFIHTNSRVMADSGEGYDRITDCMEGAMRVLGCTQYDPVERAFSEAEATVRQVKVVLNDEG